MQADVTLAAKMEAAAMPPPLKVVDACRSFLTFAERIEWYVQHPKDSASQSTWQSWLGEICRPSAFEIDVHVQDAVIGHDSSSGGDGGSDDPEKDAERIDAYTNLRLLERILSETAFSSVRFAKVSLAEALRRCEKHARLGVGTVDAWNVVMEIAKYILELPIADRASSYVMVCRTEQHNAVELLDKFPADASLYPPESYHELLVAACTAGHTSMVAQLLENGVTSPSENTGELLTSAVRYNHVDVVQQLGAAVQVPFSGAAIVNGLRLACTRGSISMVDTLLAHYSSSSNAWDHHPTLLRSAVQSDNLQVVKLLLECDPRGAFIRMDLLVKQLEREIKNGASHTPRLDAIIGKSGYVPWDLSAFEACVQKNDTVLFDLLVNHIEWNHDDLNTALATATANENEHMAKIIRLLLQSISDESEAAPIEIPIFTPGDKVEARKRGRATFSAGVINRCWLNGTYDVKFIDGADEERCEAQEDKLGELNASDKAKALMKVERELHPQMIRYRSVRNMIRIDTSIFKSDGNEASSNDQQEQKATDTSRASQESASAEAALYDPPTSPFAENDEDDRAIRADAAIIRKRVEDDFALHPEFFTLADSEDKEPPSISSSPNSGSVDKLLGLKLNSTQQQQIKDIAYANRSQSSETARVCFVEGDAVEARYRGSKAFYPAKVTFCHTNDLFDLEFDDGDQDTLVPRDAIRLSSRVLPLADLGEPIATVGTRESGAAEAVSPATGGAKGEADSFEEAPTQTNAVDNAPMTSEPVAVGFDTPLYTIGEVVEANFLSMGKFHRGKVVKVHHQNARAYDIQYADFEEIEAGVPEDRVRVPVLGKHSSKDLLLALDSGGGSSARSRKSTSKSTRNSLRTSFLSSSAVEDGEIASSTGSEALVTPRISEAVAKRKPSKSTRPLTTSSSSRCRPDENKRIMMARKGNNKSNDSTNDRITREISWRELEEWKNVDLILNRKRRFLNSQSGGIESVRVPWGEEFAAIQSLKRFATQHPDVLRAHM